jgi:hypothetical protein
VKCLVCQGSGKQTVVIAERENGEPYIIARVSCKHCGGCGEEYCCEGEQAQPEPEDAP